MDAERHAEKKGSNFVATEPLRQHRGGTPFDCSSPESDNFGYSASPPRVQPLPFASGLPMAQLLPIHCLTAFGALAQDSDGHLRVGYSSSRQATIGQKRSLSMLIKNHMQPVYQKGRGLSWTTRFMTSVEVSRCTLGNVERLSS
ncbi:hypothetical protein D3C76_277790 [compost metagenome]